MQKPRCNSNYNLVAFAGNFSSISFYCAGLYIVTKWIIDIVILDHMSYFSQSF